MHLIDQDRDADDVIENIVPHEFERPDAAARPVRVPRSTIWLILMLKISNDSPPSMRMIPHVQAKSSARAALS